MPLDPQIIARYWLFKWDNSTSDHEKELNSWVDDALYAAMQYDAEYAFQIIEAINDQDAAQLHIEVFAAGPVEDLLDHHGLSVIQEVVALASRNANFARVLGGVWKRDMDDSVWELILKHRNTDIWADART
jgi:hypothetical protein